MILHNDPFYFIYFGDKKDCCVKSNHEITRKYLSKLKDDLNLESIVLANQNHSNVGICVSDQNQLNEDICLLENSADFLITNLRHVGIAMLTADCLPIVLYDQINLVVAVIHAGWRGTVSGIVENAIDMMSQKFKTVTSNLIVYFGACAKQCCYEVDKTFLKKLEHYNFVDDIILKKDGIFFNLAELNKRLLLNRGVLLKNINMKYNICTICSGNFHSYRSDNKTDYRQVAIVVLR